MLRLGDFFLARGLLGLGDFFLSCYCNFSLSSLPRGVGMLRRRRT